MNEQQVTAYMAGDKHLSLINSRNLFDPLVNLETPIFDSFPEESDGILFSGIGSIIDPDNQFVFPILRAETTTISKTELEISDDIPSKISSVSGEQLALVTGF